VLISGQRRWPAGNGWEKTSPQTVRLAVSSWDCIGKVRAAGFQSDPTQRFPEEKKDECGKGTSRWQHQQQVRDWSLGSDRRVAQRPPEADVEKQNQEPDDQGPAAPDEGNTLATQAVERHQQGQRRQPAQRRNRLEETQIENPLPEQQGMKDNQIGKQQGSCARDDQASDGGVGSLSV